MFECNSLDGADEGVLQLVQFYVQLLEDFMAIFEVVGYNHICLYGSLYL